MSMSVGTTFVDNLKQDHPTMQSHQSASNMSVNSPGQSESEPSVFSWPITLSEGNETISRAEPIFSHDEDSASQDESLSVMPAASPISPRSLPSDSSPPLVLNKLLAPRNRKRIWDPETLSLNFHFDLRHPHDGVLLPAKNAIPVSWEIAEQPATIPPCTYLRIVHPALRWTIHARAGAFLHPELTPPMSGGKRQQRYLNYVSVLDVFRAIYLTLHEPLTRVEFELLHPTPEQRKHTIMAFYQRCRYMHLHPSYGNQEEKGVRRVDVLGVRVQFVGLIPTKMYGKFRMLLADRARERAPHGARQVDLLMPRHGEPEYAGYEGSVSWGWKDPGTTWGKLQWLKHIHPIVEEERLHNEQRRLEKEVCEDVEVTPVVGLGLEFG